MQLSPLERRTQQPCRTHACPSEPTCHALRHGQRGKALKGGAGAAQLDAVLVGQRHLGALRLPAAGRRSRKGSHKQAQSVEHAATGPIS